MPPFPLHRFHAGPSLPLLAAVTQRTLALTFLASLTLSWLALKLRGDLHAPESYKGDLHSPTVISTPSSARATCTPSSGTATYTPPSS